MRPALFMNDFHTGGAERLVLDLAMEMSRGQNVNPRVIVGNQEGALRTEFERAEIPWDSLDANISFQLVMVGTGPLENRITKQVSNSKSANRIELTGFVSKERLNKLYVAADFVVVPSIVDSAGNTEGMPTVISEAFVSRTPVIESDVGGIADVVNDEENGYLVEQKRSDQLAQRMESLIGDPALSERLTKNAKETGKELTWEHCAQTYLRIYRNVNINVEVFDEDEALFPTQ